ncbi:MAG: hypothetical protein ABIF82_13270 [Planctomycetota bacterium]
MDMFLIRQVYVLHSDPSIPDSVEYDTYKFFVERGLEIGTYR